MLQKIVTDLPKPFLLQADVLAAVDLSTPACFHVGILVYSTLTLDKYFQIIKLWIISI